MTTTDNSDTIAEDEWTDYIQPGDWVVETHTTRERRLKFLEVTDDGNVRFEDEFGSTGANLASVWQIRWEKGVLQKEVGVSE